MGTVVAVGPAVRMLGWSLVGAEVRPAESVTQARAAIADLPDTTTLLLVAPSVADALPQGPADAALPPDALVAVLP